MHSIRALTLHPLLHTTKFLLFEYIPLGKGNIWVQRFRYLFSPDEPLFITFGYDLSGLFLKTKTFSSVSFQPREAFIATLSTLLLHVIRHFKQI